MSLFLYDLFFQVIFLLYVFSCDLAQFVLFLSFLVCILTHTLWDHFGVGVSISNSLGLKNDSSLTLMIVCFWPNGLISLLLEFLTTFWSINLVTETFKNNFDIFKIFRDFFKREIIRLVMTHTSQEYGAIFIDSLHSRATSRDLSSAEYMAPFFKVDVAFYFWLVRGWSLF